MVSTRAATRRTDSPQSTTSRTSSRQGSPVKRSGGSPSDGEGRVRPTRKKLAKTSITAPETSSTAEEPSSRTSLDSVSEADPVTNGNGDSKSSGNRGRLRRKRSFEEVGDEVNGERAVGSAVKPKRKRSKDGNKAAEEADDASVSSSEGSQAQDDLTSTGDNDLDAKENITTEETPASATHETSLNVDEDETPISIETATITPPITSQLMAGTDENKSEANGDTTSVIDLQPHVNGENNLQAPTPLSASAPAPASAPEETTKVQGSMPPLQRL